MSQIAKKVFGKNYQQIRSRIDDDLIPYYKELDSDNPYLFRGCYYEEIELLFKNGYINADENSYKSFLNFRHFYLNKKASYSLYHGKNRYCIIYDRQKILNQGAIEIPDTRKTPLGLFEKIVPREWFEDEGMKLDINGNNVNEGYEGYDWDEELEERLKTLPQYTKETIPIGYLMDRSWVDEVIIKEIVLEPGLIHDIVIPISDEEWEIDEEEIYENFYKLQQLLQQYINNK